MFEFMSYVLEKLQSACNIYHNWKERIIVGKYLVWNPQQTKNVALVMKRISGVLSPQFHIKLDPSFYTVKQAKIDTIWHVQVFLIRQGRYISMIIEEECAGHPKESDQSQNNIWRTQENMPVPIINDDGKMSETTDPNLKGHTEVSSKQLKQYFPLTINCPGNTGNKGTNDTKTGFFYRRQI